MRMRSFKPAWRFLLSYLIVLTIPLALSLRVYHSATQMAYINAYESTQELLMKSSSVIDQNLDALWNYLLQARTSAEDSGYFSFPNMREDGVSVADYRYAITKLPVQTIGRLRSLLAIYSVKGDCIMTTMAVQPLNERGFGGFGVIPAGGDYRQWKDFLNGRYSYTAVPQDPVRFVDAARQEEGYLPLVHSVYAGNGAGLGNVMLFIHADDLRRIAGFGKSSDYYCAYILDRNGNVLVDYNPENSQQSITAAVLDRGREGYAVTDVQGERYLINAVDQSDYGWRYVTATPLAVVQARVDGVLHSILVLIGALTVLGMALACYFSYRNARPLHRLLQTLNGAGEGAQDYEQIDVSVAVLIENSAALKAELSRQRPMMRAALFSRWLLGDYREWTQFENELKRAGVTVQGHFYAVIVFSFENVRPIDAMNSNRAILKTLLREQITGLVDVCEMEYSGMVFAVACNGMKEEFCLSLGEQIHRVRRLLMDQLYVDTVFAGSIAERPSGVSIAYSEARRTLEERSGGPEGQVVTWYDAERHPIQRAVFYPIEMEMKLIDCLRVGDTDGCARILNQLRRENAVKNMLDLPQCKQLIRMLQTTLMRLFQQRGQSATSYITSIQQISNDLQNPPSPEDYIRLERIFLHICKDIAEEEALRDQRMGKQIEGFIDANWRDPQLSLQRIADHMGYTTAYMSRLFRQETGELFSVYVEKLRTGRAAKMLEAGGMTIEEVAAATGYGSAQVFRRAFRRQYECAPVEYLALRQKGER